LRTSGVYDLLHDLVAAGLIVAALVVALRTTRHLPGAFDPDHFRDIAQAPTTRDGHPLSQPARANEVGAMVNTGPGDCAAAAPMLPLTYRTTDVCISITQ
jgi:hypothetical protein